MHRVKASPGRGRRRKRWRKNSASSASIARVWKGCAMTGERTLYIFDVRDPSEYAAGHFPGAISAPGGQLVQATDSYAGTLGARIVLNDDKAVRALMTASWLKQMGWKDVFVLAEAGQEISTPDPAIGACDESGAVDVSSVLAFDDVSVVDL